MANELNYVDYEFDNLVQQLTDRVKLRSAWIDTYRSGTGQMLIELYAYVANLILFYVERRAEESYIGTAKLKSSVINLVQLINYTPIRNVSATGVLTFTIAPQTKKVYIPKYTEAQTSLGLSYIVTGDIVLMPGATTGDANAMQGALISTTFTGTGATDQECNIGDTKVENTGLTVYVNNEIYTKVTSFVSSTNTDKHYMLRQELDDTITIIFGDDINGRAPKVGETIDVQYIRSEGSAGNVYEAAKITTLVSTIYDEDGAAVAATVNNADVFLGGDDTQGIEEIRREAPLVFQTGDRFVNKADFTTALENYPGVACANAWGEAEESPPVYALYNTVRLVVLLENWILPSTAFKALLSEYLYLKSMMTVKYEYITADILDVVPVIRVKAVKGSSLSQIQSDIEAALDLQFTIGTTSRLGTSKRLSDLIDTVEAVANVSYIHMYLEVYKALTAWYISTFEYGGLLGAVPIETGSIRVYHGTTLIATDNGAGGFTSEAGWTVTGSVNYTTGIMNIDITPDATLTVSVRYRQVNAALDDEGDIVVTNRQICRLGDVDITSIGYES